MSTIPDQRGLREILSSHYPDPLGQQVLYGDLLAYVWAYGEAVREAAIYELEHSDGDPVDRLRNYLSLPEPKP